MTHMIFIAAASGDAVKAILLVMKLRWATKGERKKERTKPNQFRCFKVQQCNRTKKRGECKR